MTGWEPDALFKRSQEFKTVHIHGAAAERSCHGWIAQWGKHNGIATPQEAAEEERKLRRIRRAAYLKRIRESHRRLSRVIPPERRLEPDGWAKGSLKTFNPSTSKLPPEANKRSGYKLNEFSCYLCRRPMLNQKHLEQHIRGWKHKRVLESWSMNAHRESYHRDNPHHHEYSSGRSRVVIQEPTQVNRQLKEEHPPHWNNRVHLYCGPDYCGPGPDCDSQNDNREPPDDPAETGLYGMYTAQPDTIP